MNIESQIPYLSICIPCNGRVNYLRNTLQSIYNEITLKSRILLSEFEVIISDNGDNDDLNMLMSEFKYENCYYFRTTCEGFMNSYHSLTYGRGRLLKLHNSQELFNNGTLKVLIETVKDNNANKPLIFFSSGLLKRGNVRYYNSFDEFMYNLSYLSSWSNGFSLWKEDFEKLKDERTKLNPLFPHTSLFLTQNYKKQFLINDQKLFTTQFVNKRGGHNKFQAFSIEYPSIIHEAFTKKSISEETMDKVLHDVLYEYLPLLYFNVKIARRETYDNVGFKDDIQKYFPPGAYYIVLFRSIIVPMKIVWRKFKMKYLLKSKF